MRQFLVSSSFILILTIAGMYPFTSTAQDTTCTPKKTHLSGQTIELDEKCMLSFPGYGNNNFGRSYTDQFGELFVFAQVAETGVDAKDYGSRTYYLLPFRQTSDFEVNEYTGELIIHHSSGETMTLAPDFKVKSFTGVEYVEADKSSDANKGGFEIKKYNNGILLDTGWTHSAITIKPEGQSVFTDRNGKTCKVRNSDIFDFVGQHLEDANFKYPQQEALKKYLKKACPKLDLSPLEPADELNTYFSAANGTQAEGVSCRCTFNGTKNYQLYDVSHSFFGRQKVHRKWTCEYSCRAGDRTDIVAETVTGSYEMTTFGEDDGREGICEGTVYESVFNQYVMREVYTYKSTESFNPKKAKASELRQWAASQSCNRGSIFN